MVIIVLMIGCTFRIPQPIHRIDIPPVDNKINLQIGLVITEDYRNKEFIIKGGDTYILPVGENLVYHSKAIVNQVFTDPIILKGNEEKKYSEKIEYYLKPKVLMTERTTGVFSFSESKTTIGVEWKLYKKEPKPLWVETIVGTGVGQSGGVFELYHILTKNMKSALQDLFAKSQKAMVSSNLLRKLKNDKNLLAKSYKKKPDRVSEGSAPNDRLRSVTPGDTQSLMSQDLPDPKRKVSIDDIPSAELCAEQIRDLFSNKIVKGTHLRRGFSFIRYFKPDGTLVEESPKTGKLSGKWRTVRNRLCIKWNNGKGRCGKIAKKDGKINLYGVRKSSANAPAVVYEEFYTANDQ